MQLLAKIMGDPNKKDLRAIQPLVDEINELEPRIKELTDEELSAKTGEFRSQLYLYLKGGLLLEDELVKLFREVLNDVEPLATQFNDEQLQAAVTEFRQNLERHEPEIALKDLLASTLSECFEQSYEKLYPLLITDRVAMAMDLAEERQEWPHQSDNPKHATLTLLKEVEPALKDVDGELLDEAFATIWQRFEESQHLANVDGGAHKPLEQLLAAILKHLQPEIVAIRADVMDTLTSAMAKRYKTGKTLDDLLPEAFAVVREAGLRKIKMPT